MDRILVMDFGGQYNQLIARRVRENHVYAEIKGYDEISSGDILSGEYKGIILTGGPNSVYEENAPTMSAGILNCGIPVLGICYGAQLIAHLSGGTVIKAGSSGEYGKTVLHTRGGDLLNGTAEESICWMSHSDRIDTLPEEYTVTAFTGSCPIAAFEDHSRHVYGVQFHPEVTQTEIGAEVIRRFVLEICGCRQDWNMDDFIETTVRKYAEELKGRKVLLALSGGVDSAVTAVLLSRAVGQNLCCVFVDHGLLRLNEAETVEKTFREGFGLNFVRADARSRFLDQLKTVTDPEQKRKIIGSEFIRVFEEEAVRSGYTDVLAQGTIYPDVVESGRKHAETIKSHHNVGGLPEHSLFQEIVEPLRELFKDEVREVGRKLGIPDDIVYRQPFPGPGLAVRIMGEVTEEKLNLLKQADRIFREELEGNLQDTPDQYFAVLTETRAVGVLGDARTYGYALVLRAVTTEDFMTAEWTRLPYELLGRISTRIINEVRGISRIVYDITSKPPGTVEWE